MSEKGLFSILYNSYAKNDNDDFDAVYNRYKTDPKATIEINGITFYHALNITRVCTRKCEFVVLLDNRLGLKTNDVLVDEAGKEYIVNGFPMIRFISGIPEWYSKISMVTLSGNVDNVGHYFARKEADFPIFTCSFDTTDPFEIKQLENEKEVRK